MSRSATPYGEMTSDRASFDGFDINVPIKGFFEMKLRSGGVMCGVKIWYGQPVDPATLEPMDRSLGWNALVNDEWADIERVWPMCAPNRITERRYQQYCRKQGWAKENLPGSALANPRKKNDPLNSPLQF